MHHLKTGAHRFFGLLAIAAAFTFAMLTPSMAQGQQGLTQVELTDANVQGYLKIGSKLGKMFDRIDKAGGNPGKKLMADLNALSKEGGFKSFDDMEVIVANITFIMSGLNEEDGSFKEPVEVLKMELKETEADKELKGAERKEIIASITESIKETPKLKYAGNVAVVKKHMKALAGLFQ